MRGSFCSRTRAYPSALLSKERAAKARSCRGLYKEITIDGEPCYQKFRAPESIKIVVAGGTAGKFSAVIGSWSAGPRGSQMVTYPI